MLTRVGVETTYYDPLVGDGIERLMRPNTKVVYVESPGSLTFEVQDIPAIAAVAHRYGARVLMDNTWATPYLFRPFEHGVDVSIHAATKYIGGHSDIMLGAVVTNEESWLPVRSMIADLGHCAGPDDIFFALRGMRTLSVRLNGTRRTRWRWRAGCIGRKSRGCSTLRCPKTPDTRCGNAIFSAPAGCSGSC